MIRIANGQGFWGDSLEAPLEQIRRGPLDYLTLDYLAEITMSILQKQRARDPKLGYARDFVDMVARGARDIVEKKIKVVANAGGVNPEACREAVARALGTPGIPLAVVAGDDIMGQLDTLRDQGVALKHMDTGEPLETIRPFVQSANVYFGAAPIAQALDQGAQFVITGRCTDTGLVLGPMIHEFGWALDDWDRIAAGTIAGHTVECGAQCTGGNCQVDWESIPDFADIGYPIVEAEPDGTFVVTKHAGTGGRVTVESVQEQLLYELGDPHSYITPDCVADFTSIRLTDGSPDRVHVSGIRGGPRPPTLKLSVSFTDGWKAIGTLVYSWPDALLKARAANRIVRQRLQALGLQFDEIYTECFGVNACQGQVAAAVTDPPEVQLRIGVRCQDRKAADRFTRELIPLVLNGPPGATGFGEGRPPVREIVAYWSALLPREEINTRVEVIS